MILECDATGKGELSVEKVNQSARMLGSGFLHDMIGVKKTKGRIYDAANMTIDEDEDSAWEAPAMVSEDLTEEDLLESLLQDGDEDALFISDYESAILDSAREDPELATAFNAYTDARKRLSERFRNRGFWPSSYNKGKGKGSKKKSQGGFRANARVSSSACWRPHAESAAAKGTGKPNAREEQVFRINQYSTAAPTMTAETSEPMSNNAGDFLRLEFLHLPEIREAPLDEPRLHTALISTKSLRGKTYELKGNHGDNGNRDNHKMGLSKYIAQGNAPSLRSDQPALAASRVHDMRAPEPVSELANAEPTMFVSHETFGILDTGATKSVIGSDLLPDLIKGLKPKIQQKLFRCQCSVTFRFGNRPRLCALIRGQSIPPSAEALVVRSLRGWVAEVQDIGENYRGVVPNPSWPQGQLVTPRAKSNKPLHRPHRRRWTGGLQSLLRVKPS